MFESLDIKEPVADLDVGVGPGGDEVDFLAMLNRFLRQRSEPCIGCAEPLAERSPFPARDDGFHESCVLTIFYKCFSAALDS